VIDDYWVNHGFMSYDIVAREVRKEKEYTYDADKETISPKDVNRENRCMKLGLVGYDHIMESYVEYNESISINSAGVRLRITVESKITYGDGPEPLLGVMIYVTRPSTGKKYYAYRKTGETENKNELQWIIETVDTPCIEVPYDSSDSWQSWEFITDEIPFDEDDVTVHLRLHRPIEVASDGANVGTTYYDNIGIWGTAETEAAPSEYSEEIELSTDNTETPSDTVIKIGDCYRTRPSSSTSHPTNEFLLKGVKPIIPYIGSKHVMLWANLPCLTC